MFYLTGTVRHLLRAKLSCLVHRGEPLKLGWLFAFFPSSCHRVSSDPSQVFLAIGLSSLGQTQVSVAALTALAGSHGSQNRIQTRSFPDGCPMSHPWPLWASCCFQPFRWTLHTPQPTSWFGLTAPTRLLLQPVVAPEPNCASTP